MAAMSFLLLPAAMDLQADIPEVQQALFADDRSFACKSSGQLAAVSRKWGAWMQFLGLRERWEGPILSSHGQGLEGFGFCWSFPEHH